MLERCDRCGGAFELDPVMRRVPIRHFCDGCERECCGDCGEHDYDPEWGADFDCHDCLEAA